MPPKINKWEPFTRKRVSYFDLGLQMAIMMGSTILLAPLYKEDDDDIRDAVKRYQTERRRFEELLLKRRNAITKANESDVSLGWREKEELDKIKQAQKKAYISRMSMKATAKSWTEELMEEKAKVLGLKRPSDKRAGEDGKWPGDT